MNIKSSEIGSKMKKIISKKYPKLALKKLWQDGRFSQAISLLENFIKDCSSKTYEKAYCDLGYSYDHNKEITEKKRYEIAKSWYRKAIAINKKSICGHQGLGMLLWYQAKALRVGESELKKELLKKSFLAIKSAYKFSNRDPEILPLMANIKFSQGSINTARGYLKSAVKKLKDPFGVYVNGAFRFSEIGMSGSAKEFAIKALELAPRHWDLKKSVVQEYVKKLENIAKK